MGPVQGSLWECECINLSHGNRNVNGSYLSGTGNNGNVNVIVSEISSLTVFVHDSYFFAIFWLILVGFYCWASNYDTQYRCRDAIMRHKSFLAEMPCQK